MRLTSLLGVALAWVLTFSSGGHAQAQPTSANTGAASSTTTPDTSHSTGNLEVLTNTEGIDFGPYLSSFVQKVRTNWYNYIPQEARPPQLATGVTSIEFAILRNGHLAGMRIVHPAGLVVLDRAAWGGIAASNPLDPLPSEFKGDFLKLRMHFCYNPAKLPPDQQPTLPPADSHAEQPKPH